MKKLLFTIIAMVALLLTSCTKSVESKLIGTWRFLSYETEKGESLFPECLTENTLTFSDNNTYQVIQHKMKDGKCVKLDKAGTGIWSLSDNEENITMENTSVQGVQPQTGSLEFDDDKLIIIFVLDQEKVIAVLEKD
jgi:hypothetical protein